MQFFFAHGKDYCIQYRQLVTQTCFGLVWASAMFFQEFFDSFEDDSMSPILVTRTCGDGDIDAEHREKRDIADLSMVEVDFKIGESDRWSIERIHPHVFCNSVKFAPRMCSAISLMKSNQHLWAKIRRVRQSRWADDGVTVPREAKSYNNYSQSLPRQ